MRESAKPKRPTRMHSMHAARNQVTVQASGIYEIVIADFSKNRSTNSLAWLTSLVSYWNKNPPFIEYYSTLDRLPNKNLQCAQVLNCWLDGRKVKAKVKISGHYGRHLDEVLFNNPNFDVALKGTYDASHTAGSYALFEYTSITGLRFVFPDLRRW